MSDTVRILAPAPIRHVPARSRLTRNAYAPVYEDAVLRDLSSLDAPEGPRIPLANGQTLATRILDGVPWRAIGSPDAFAVNRPAGPNGATFRKWLEGSEETRELDGTDLGRCLEGTPLLARVPGQKLPVRPTGLWNVARQGALILDGRERMPALVRDYVAGNIALVDGMPFMRMPGPLAYITTTQRSMAMRGEPESLRMRVVGTPGGWTTNPAVAMGNLYRVDRLKDVARAERVRISKIETSWNVSDFEGMPLRDDDIAVMLKESIRILVHNTPAMGYPFEPERSERLLAYSALSSVGAIEEREMADAWRFIRDFSRSVTQGTNMGWVIQESRRILAYADSVAVQRAALREFDHTDDIEALGALAMS